MNTRTIVKFAVAVAALAALAVGGYAVVTTRAGGSGASQPTATPSLASASPTIVSTPTQPPPPERWMVAKVLRPLDVYGRPATTAPVKTHLERLNANRYPNVMLVKNTRESDGVIWYHVYVAMRPNGSTGWVPEGDVALYPTTAKIVIDLSQRTLTVTRRGQQMGTFPVAIGTADLPTPTGFFFVNQKLKPPTSNTAFGVLAIGISAFQMKLPASAWAQGGPVAIHGTNDPSCIGKAVSHGCVRMYNADVLKVSDWVPTGSPVIIQK